MKKTLNKIKRVKPLIKSKKADFDREVSIFEQIKFEKIEAINHLRQNQQKYLDGANQMNSEREKGNFQAASVLEPSLEYVKSKWHESLKNVQTLENKQDEQLKKVMSAQSELKSFEALEEKYIEEFKKIEKLNEQKALDELASMRQI